MRLPFIALLCFILCLRNDSASAAKRKQKRRRTTAAATSTTTSADVTENSGSGYALYRKGLRLLKKGDPSSKLFFQQAVMKEDLVDKIDLQDALQEILTAYQDAGIPWVGHIVLADVMKKANNREDARQLVEMALQSNPHYAEAYLLKAELVDHDVDLYKMIMQMLPDLQGALRYGGMDDAHMLRRAAALYSSGLVWVR
jgi:tetratricopeptide (TPR) repeat protein